MVIDGVTGELRGADRAMQLAVKARLIEDGAVTDEFDLREGDGFCMGFHGWRDGDFGDWPVTVAARARMRLYVL